MSRRLSKDRSRRSRSRHSLFTPKPSNPPWMRGRLIFEQLEHRVPPGSLLGSPLGDAAVLGAASLATIPPSGDNRIDGSKTVSQASTVAQDARQPWLYSPSSPAPAATRGAEHDSSDARMEDTPPIATSAALMSSVQVGLGLHLEHELTPLSDEADEEQEHRGRSTLESMFPDDSNRRNSDPSRGLEGISIGEDLGAAAGGGATGGFGTGTSFASAGSSAELPFWPSGTGSLVPPGQSAVDQTSAASAEPESAEASAPLTASAPTDRAAHSQRLGFDDGLDGWTVSQSGGSLDGLGTVTSGSAVLREGDSFLVTLEREIVIPDDPVAIEFIYIASFDTSVQDRINDAFEVALLDSDGYSLVDTFTAQRDAYFNLTEDLPASLGAGVAHAAVSQGHQVTLDISRVPPGTQATLAFRLVNNDTDTETTVTIVSVDVTSQATPPSVTIGLLNDTAPDGQGSEPYRTDLLTNDPTVTGTATDDEAVVLLEAQVNDGPFVDITAALIGDTYTFDPGPLPAGPHRITVRATDQHGNAGSSSLDFRVNTPPLANAGPDRTVDEGSQVEFDASASFDAEDPLFAYQWTFHDSTTAAGMSASRVYPQDGVYPVSLTVTDTAGSVATHTIDVVVANVPPTVVTATDLAGLQGESLNFTATFTDPGIFDTHTARIDWGDGTVTPATVDQTSGGGTVTASHIYTDGGTFTIRVEVTDDAGDSGSRLATATVEHLPTGSISGYVYLDVNNNGIKDPPEQVLPNVPITLGGTVSRSVVTGADGSYLFDELPPGTYEIIQSQPLAFDDGRDTQGTPLLGSVENNRFYDIQLGADVHAVSYNFGELGLRAPFIGKHLLLASTPPAGQLLAELMVPGGDWYGFRAATEGTATVSVPANVSEPVIQIYTANMKPVAMSEGQHRLTAPVQQGQQYVLHVSGRGGEAEFQPTLQFNLTPPPSPLAGRTNPNNSLDVNADGHITPQDALILVNALNATSVAAAQATNDYYLDVDGNGLVTPADVLMVINHLNATRPPAASSGEGEGAKLPTTTESAPSNSAVTMPANLMVSYPVSTNPLNSPGQRILSPEGEGDQDNLGQDIGGNSSSASMTAHDEIRLVVHSPLDGSEMPANTRVLLGGSATGTTDPGGITSGSITFESIPAGIPTQGLAIGSQFYASEGIRFSYEDGSYPVLAQVGSPRGAFEGYGQGDDEPAPGQHVGSFFLTDSLLGVPPAPLNIHFEQPVSNVSGVVLDIDTEPALMTVFQSDGSQGWYNESLRNLLDGTSPLFPISADPRIPNAPEPDLSPVAHILGEWLTDAPPPDNGNWNYQSIPYSWPITTETAIVYEIDGGPGGITNLRGNFGVDNGIFVWLNGEYRFGALAPGGVGRYEYPNIPLGDLRPGKNYLQILREDHGVTNGYVVLITGELIPAEAWLFEALDSNGIVTETIVVGPDAPNAGNGLATPWTLNRPRNDIHSVRVSYAGNVDGAVDYALDNITWSTTVDHTPRPIAAVLVNGVGVEVLDAAGNFFTQVDILPGENVFHVTALDAYGQTADTTVTVFGSQDPAGHVDLLFDVSPSFEPLYARTSFDERIDWLFAELAIRNVGQYPADNPFYVGVRNISDPTVTVRETVGTTRDGTPYYNFSQVLPGDSLAPEGVTGFVNAVFHNPNRVQFTYDLVFLAKLNEPPVFTTVPIVETHAGWTYRYDAQATDPDGDPLTYSLLSGPWFMTVDPATGQVNWLPAESDLGVHPIILHVHDGRGGSAEQRYLLSVTETPPNRPPYIVSVPVTEATVSTDGEATYEYDAVAIDPDLDPIAYSLLDGPAGAQINPATGLVTWAPTAAQIGLHDVGIEATDGRGGFAQQAYVVQVIPDSENRPPLIISEPLTFVSAGEEYSYQVVAIDLDGDSLTYSLLAGPDAMSIEAENGLITWNKTDDSLGLHSVAVRVSDGRGGMDHQEYTLHVIDPELAGRVVGTVYDDINRNGIRDSDLFTGDEPIIVFVVDVSGSMNAGFAGTGGGTRMDALVAALELFSQRLVDLGLGEAATVSLVAFAGDAVAIDMDPRPMGPMNLSQLRWTLTGPAGTPIHERRWDRTDSADGLSLIDLSPGTHALTVTIAGSSTGEYTFRLLDLALAEPVVVGAEATGQLRPGNETKAYRFDAVAGGRFFFEMVSLSGGSASGRWRLLDPHGQVVFNQSLASSVDTVTIGHDGAYTLLLEGRISEHVTRNYSFVVHPVEYGDQSLVIGSEIQGAIEVPGERDLFRFTLDERTSVYMDSLINRSDFNWTLEGPTGTVVPARRLDRSDSSDGLSLLELLPGSYVLTVNADGTATGEYAFRLLDLASANEISVGSPVSGELLRGFETALYRFEGVGDQQFYFDMQTLTGGSTNASWRLIDPYGQTVFNERLSADVDTLRLEKSGTYTLLLEGRVSEAIPRTYTFNVQPVEYVERPLAVGTVVQGTLGVPGERDFYRFDIPTRQFVYVDSLTNSSTLNWTLEGPAGAMVNAQRFDRTDSADGLFVLDLMAGSYTLMINGQGAATGDYGFRLMELVTAEELTLGVPISGELDPGFVTRLYRFDATVGDQFSFRMESLSGGSTTGRWRLIDPYGQTVFTQGLASNVDLVTADQTGTYNLLLEGRITEPDERAYTFSVELVGHDPRTPVDGIALQLDAVTTGEIAVAGESVRYVLTLAERSQLYFDSMTNSSGFRWSLTGPTGNLVTNRRFDQSDSAGGFSVLELPAGTHVLRVSSTGGTTGAFSFRLLDLASADVVNPGTAVRGSLDPGTSTDLYRFDASASEQFYFEMQSLTGGNTGARWRLLDPYGRVLFNQVLSSDADTVSLQYDGTYTLLLEGRVSEPTPRDYVFQIWPVEDLDFTLATMTTINGVITVPGETHRYNFHVNEHSHVYVDSLTNTGNLRWTLEGPTGGIVAARRFDRTDSADGLSLMELAPGPYTIIVSAVGSATGEYGFRVLDLALAEEIVVGANVASELLPGNQTDAYQFDAVAGDLLFFEMVSLSGGSSSGRWRLLDPYGQVVFNQRLGSNVDTVTIGHDGPYTLLVEGRISEEPTRDYSFLVHPVNYGDHSLVLGLEIQGRIEGPGERDLYHFTVHERTWVYMDSLANRSNVNWTLEGPTGTLVTARRFDRSDSSDGLSLLELVPGNYLLTVAADGTDTADYGFRLLDLASATEITPGLPFSGELPRGIETALYRFEALEDQQFYFDMQALTGGSTNARWRLIDPYGQTVFNERLSADVDTLRLENGGRYTLLLEGRVAEATPRTYTFNVQPVEYVEQALALGTVVEGTLGVPGERDFYRFDIPTRQFVYVDSLTNSSTLNWTLEGPGGVIVNAQRFDRTDSADGLFVLDLMAGSYTMAVNGQGTTIGDYGFRIVQLESAVELTPGVPVSGVLDPGFETQLYRFDASAGDQFSFAMESLSGGSTAGRWRLIDPYGQTVFTQALASDVELVTVGHTGTYTLLLEGRITEPVARAYTFSVQLVGHEPQVPADGLALPLDTVATGEIAAAGASVSYVLKLAERTQVYFDSMTNSSGFRWSLTGPTGNHVSNRRFDQSDSAGGLSLLDLPAGEHVLTVTTTGGTTGTFSFRLLNLASAAVLAAGTPVSAALDPGTSTHLYRFSVTAGEHFYFQMHSLSGGSTTARWRLVDPYGRVVFNERLSSDVDTLALEHDGTYTLLLEGRVSEPAARNYVFQIWPVEHQLESLDIGLAVRGEISVPGQRDTYQFTVPERMLVYTDVMTRDFLFGTTPLTDLDANGIPDFEQLVRNLPRAGGTNYQVPLIRAIEVFEQLPDSPSNRNLIFVSDGERVGGTSGAEEVAQLRAMGVNLQAFAIGYQAPLSHLQVIDPNAFRFGDADELYDVFSGLRPDGVEFLEPPLPGWTVFVDANDNGVLDPGELWTTSDEDGIYEFTGLAPGKYSLRAVPQYGWQQTQPWAGHYVVDLQPGATVRARDFGFHEIPATAEVGPVITSQPPDTVVAGELWRYPATALAPDNHPLIFDLPLAPAGMTVHPERGVVVWQPTRDQVGAHQVVLRVRDDHGGSDLQSFTITVAAPNSPPVITSTPPSLAVVDLPLQYVVRAQDADGDQIEFQVEDAPAGVEIEGDSGLLTWTPTADQLGSHAFSIVASDGRGGQAMQAVTLEVVATAPNDPPVINSQPRLRARVGQVYGYLIEAHDPNGDPLSYHLDVFPAGMTVDAAGVVQWQPASELLGTTQPVSIRVEDGRGGVATQEFDLQVVSQDSNQPPIITSTTPLTGIVGRTYQYQLAARDPEGDPVLWSLDTAPAGMSIDPLRGTLRWTPAADQTGSHRVVVRVQDIFLASSTQAFDLTIRAVNLPPSIRSTPPVLANPDELYAYAVRAVDPDGDPLSFRLAVKPDGMTIDEGTGLVRWTPSAADVGQHTVRIVAEDGQGGIDSQTYTLNVGQQPRNRPPVITSTPVHYATAQRLYQYAVSAYDPEGGSLRYSLELGPDDMAINATTGLVTWTPAADSPTEQTVTVVVSDDAEARATQSYLLTVRPNQPPQITPPPDQSVAAGASYRYDVRATDPEGDAITFVLDDGPTGMTMDDQGRIRWQPTAADVGTHTVQVTARDSYGESDTASYQLTVTADTEAPRVTLSASTNLVNPGGAVVFQVHATDNVGVESLNLTVGGTAVSLDAQGRATVAMDQPGLIDAVATATDAAGNVGTSSIWQVRVFDPTDQEAPKVTIHSPDYDEVIGYRADVVISVEDDKLDYWHVEYAPANQIDTGNIGADNPNYRLLAEGSESVDQQAVATIDATLLANDAYFLRVVAYNMNGLGWVEPLMFSVAGNAKLGNFAFTVTDFAVSLAGIPITISRSYDTLQASNEGDFGFGWSMAISDPNIAETTPAGMQMQEGDRVFLTNPEGKRVGFTYTPVYESAWVFGAMAHPAFTPDPGVYDTLSVKEGPYGVAGVVGALSGTWNPSQYVLTTRDGTVYEYIQDRGLQKITDPHGNTVTFTKAAITHSDGEQVQLIRDARGQITQIIDTTGQSLRYQYDAARNLVGFTNQIDATTRYVYRNTPAHFLDEIHDSLNVRIFKAEFDDDGRLTGATDALGNVVQQEFDPGAFSGTITDARGNVTTIWYDQQGNVTQEQSAPVINPITGDSVTYTKTYEYTDPRHPDKETKIIEYDGTIVEHQYDAAGNTIKTTRTSADGTQADSTEFAYDAKNNLTKMTTPGGVTSTFGYTGNDVTSLTSALGDVARTTYDSLGRQTSFTDFNKHTTTYGHAAGCSSCSAPALVTHPDGSYEVRLSNRLGLVTRTDYFEAGGTLVYVTTTGYDNLGRKTRETVGTGSDEVVTTYLYHGSTENVTRQTVVHPTDPSQNRVTHYFYDAAGNLIRQVDPDSDPSDPRAGIFFKYDASGNRVWLMDPVGNVTTWIYDPLDRVIEERDPLYWHGTDWWSMDDAEILTLISTPTPVQSAPFHPSHITRYHYDGAGNVIEQIDRNGRRRTFEYDHRSNMLAEVWYNAADDVTPIRELLFTYDTAGNMLTAADPDAEYIFTYDVMNRLTTMSVDYPWATNFDTFTLAYQYDAMGNVISATDSTGVAVKSTYDSRNRLDSRWWEGDDVDNIRADFAYTALGQLAHIARWADKERTTSAGTTHYTHDLAGRPKQIVHKNAADEVLAGYDYEFDFSGLLTKETLTHINAEYSRTANYAYDQRGQLISALYDNDQQDEWYAYDVNGNRTGSYLHGNGYRTGPGNQLLSDGTFDYTYDHEGNMVTKTRITPVDGEVNYTEYEHDFRNRMTKTTLYSKHPGEGGIILHEQSNRYDAIGRRVHVTGDGEETIGVFDRPSFMANEWARFNAAGEVIQRLVFTNRADQVIAQWTQSEGVSCALTDHLGTVRDMINTSAQIVQHIRYTSFGRPTLEVPAVHSDLHPHAFTGRVWDGLSGLSLHRSRFYDVTVGRFVSTDNIGFLGDDMNLYRYANNCPSLLIDLSGNAATLGYAIKVGAIAGALLAPATWITCKIAIGESGDITFSKVVEKAVVGALVGAAIKAALFKAGAYMQIAMLTNMSQAIPKVGPITLTALKIWLKNCSFLEIVGGL